MGSGPYGLPLFYEFIDLSVLMPCAQQLLVEFAHAGLGYFFDEGPSLRNPPARDARSEIGAEGDGVDGRAGLAHNAGQRPLVPLFVGNADHRRFKNFGVVDDRILELYGRDPFAAGLDDVLGPVGDADVALPVDDAYIAGAQPSIVKFFGKVGAIIGRRDP